MRNIIYWLMDLKTREYNGNEKYNILANGLKDPGIQRQ